MRVRFRLGRGKNRGERRIYERDEHRRGETERRGEKSGYGRIKERGGEGDGYI